MLLQIKFCSLGDVVLDGCGKEESGCWVATAAKADGG